MKIIIRLAVIAAVLTGVLPRCAAIVGYYNYSFSAGDNLFQNNLSLAPNHLSTMFLTTVPEGTTVSLWNPTANTFDVTSVYLQGAWSLDLTLQPGTGARLTAPTPFLNTFTGSIINRDGTPAQEDHFVLPPPFSGPNGTYLLGDSVPMASTGTNLFMYVMGRLPNVGEQITRLDAQTQTYSTSTYLGAGAWDIEPANSVGEALFFNIGPVPEPSTVALALVGLGLLRVTFRRKL